jgi:DNA-directed RNA polymerase sigma subunit (sigma70/sigma32)
MSYTNKENRQRNLDIFQMARARYPINSFSRIALDFGITRERVRQIVNKMQRLHDWNLAHPESKVKR